MTLMDKDELTPFEPCPPDDPVLNHPMFRLDRAHVEVVDSFEEGEKRDREYWHSRTPEERLLYMEYLRRTNYGRAALAPLVRVLELVEPGSD